MKKALSLLPVLALTATLGFAQSTPDRSQPADNSGPVSNDQRSGSNWGWIGLLGLAGLAGLGGRKSAAERDNIRMRPAA